MTCFWDILTFFMMLFLSFDSLQFFGTLTFWSFLTFLNFDNLKFLIFNFGIDFIYSIEGTPPRLDRKQTSFHIQSESVKCTYISNPCRSLNRLINPPLFEFLTIRKESSNTNFWLLTIGTFSIQSLILSCKMCIK